jgi:protease IV
VSVSGFWLDRKEAAMSRAVPALLCLLVSGCMSFNTVELDLGRRTGDYTEKTVSGEGDAKVAVIDLEGILSQDSEESIFGSRESQVVAFVEKLKMAEKDPDVKAVVVRIDSPGGDVTTSDILLNELRRFRERKKVPAVAAFMGVAASGGYYVAAGCDRIVAHPTTITGSIGVIALHVSLSGLLEKIGVKVTALKAGERKDTGSPFRELGEDDRRLLQGLIDQAHARFVGVVAEGRAGRLTAEQVRPLADGRIFTAAQALEARLIDRIGYLADAAEEARGLAGLKDARLVMYSRRPQKLENPYSIVPTASAGLGSDLDRARRLLGFHVCYLWEPYLLGR